MKNNIWVIVPAFNEAAYIERVLQKLLSHWNNVIVVDDGSSDRTSVLAKMYTEHVLTHEINLGKGAALKTGCEYAFDELGAVAVVFFDADDQHDASYVPQIISLLKNAPVVLGVRAFNNQMSLLKIALNRVASMITLVFFGQYIPDIPSGFKAIAKSVYKKINWSSSDYLVEVEIAARIAKYEIPFATISIPTIYHDLDRGMTVLDIVHVAGKVLSWRFGK